MTAPVLHLQGVTASAAGQHVLHGIDLVIRPGETLGLIGGSGSGKSTLARIALGLLPPQSGIVQRQGSMAAIFQDPQGSLDPRWRIGRIVAEPLDALPRRQRPDRATRRQRVAEMLAATGLPPDAASRRPAAFSGGQRQRIAIARALIGNPALLVADEPVSALDVSVQAQILNLLIAERATRSLAMLFISHDLAVIRHMAQRVAVLQDGRIVEEGPAAELLAAPRHPYTRHLLAAQPGLPAPGFLST